MESQRDYLGENPLQYPRLSESNQAYSGGYLNYPNLNNPSERSHPYNQAYIASPYQYPPIGTQIVLNSLANPLVYTSNSNAVPLRSSKKRIICGIILLFLLIIQILLIIFPLYFNT